MNTEICERFHIAATHPALPGHFPDDPVVPGAILLERAATAAERAWRVRIVGVTQAKFLRPLRPEQEAQLTLRRETQRAQWRILRSGELVASGVFELAA